MIVKLFTTIPYKVSDTITAICYINDFLHEKRVFFWLLKSHVIISDRLIVTWFLYNLIMVHILNNLSSPRWLTCTIFFVCFYWIYLSVPWNFSKIIDIYMAARMSLIVIFLTRLCIRYIKFNFFYFFWFPFFYRAFTLVY